MNLSAAATKRVGELRVMRGDGELGLLERTKVGARFTYHSALVESHLADSAQAVCFAMPVRPEPYEVQGVNLHAFFAGLLPEGLRLRALVRDVKTSEDDLFSLLVALGGNTVGDVWVTNEPGVQAADEPTIDVHGLADSSFAELLEDSLHLAKRSDPLAIAGVQPKVSAAMISLPLRARGGRHSYILKLAPPEFPRLIENEAFFMDLARSLKLPTAQCTIVEDRTGETGLLVERFDRVYASDQEYPVRLHQEDACQLLGHYPADKYRLPFGEIAESLEVCTAPVVERLRLLQLQALSYLIANGDLHAKNISIQVAQGHTRLTPIYDLLSTLPYGDGDLAIQIEGRDKRLKRKHFLACGERMEIRPAATNRMLNSLLKGVAPRIAHLDKVGLTPRKTAHLERTMRQRLTDLGD